MQSLRQGVKDFFSPSTQMAEYPSQQRQQPHIRSALKAKSGSMNTDPRLATKPLPIISNNNHTTPYSPYSKAGKAPQTNTNTNANAGPSNTTHQANTVKPDPAREHAERLLDLAQEAQSSYAGILSDSLAHLKPGATLSRADLLEILSLLGGTLHAVEQGVTSIETKSQSGEVIIPESARPYLQGTMVIVQGILVDVSERCQEYAKSLSQKKRTAKTQALTSKDVMSAFVSVTIVVLESFTKLSTDCLRRLQ